MNKKGDHTQQHPLKARTVTVRSVICKEKQYTIMLLKDEETVLKIAKKLKNLKCKRKQMNCKVGEGGKSNFNSVTNRHLRKNKKE